MTKSLMGPHRGFFRSYTNNAFDERTDYMDQSAGLLPIGDYDDLVNEAFRRRNYLLDRVRLAGLVLRPGDRLLDFIHIHVPDAKPVAFGRGVLAMAPWTTCMITWTLMVDATWEPSMISRADYADRPELNPEPE